MDFTPEQEQQLIEQNMVKIYRAVDNYSARHTTDAASVPYDDFVQEVAMAYLLYIRQCKTMDEVNRFPWFSAMDAMRRLVRVYQPMKCTSSPKKFSEVIHNMPLTLSTDEIRVRVGAVVDGMSKHWVEDQETWIDFDSFMKEQPELFKRVVSMRWHGMTMKEIGNQCGVTKGAVHKWIGKMSDAYNSYMEGAENAD